MRWVDMVGTLPLPVRASLPGQLIEDANAVLMAPVPNRLQGAPVLVFRGAAEGQGLGEAEAGALAVVPEGHRAGGFLGSLAQQWTNSCEQRVVAVVRRYVLIEATQDAEA